MISRYSRRALDGGERHRWTDTAVFHPGVGDTCEGEGEGYEGSRELHGLCDSGFRAGERAQAGEQESKVERAFKERLG